MFNQSHANNIPLQEKYSRTIVELKSWTVEMT